MITKIMTKTTAIPLLRSVAVASLLLVAAAQAAPNIPSSELPGRERQRFQDSPLDRFTQPSKPPQPLYRWDCPPRKAQKSKSRVKRAQRC